MFATYKYCLAQSAPSNLILTTKRELNIDGVRAFFLSIVCDVHFWIIAIETIASSGLFHILEMPLFLFT